MNPTRFEQFVAEKEPNAITSDGRRYKDFVCVFIDVRNVISESGSFKLPTSSVS